MNCDIMPPREILDVLHLAEAAGVDIPEMVDEWWRNQTKIDQLDFIISNTTYDHFLER